MFSLEMILILLSLAPAAVLFLARLRQEAEQWADRAQQPEAPDDLPKPRLRDGGGSSPFPHASFPATGSGISIAQRGCGISIRLAEQKAASH